MLHAQWDAFAYNNNTMVMLPAGANICHSSGIDLETCSFLAQGKTLTPHVHLLPVHNHTQRIVLGLPIGYTSVFLNWGT
jgi:hypothetical protein